MPIKKEIAIVIGCLLAASEFSGCKRNPASENGNEAVSFVEDQSASEVMLTSFPCEKYNNKGSLNQQTLTSLSSDGLIELSAYFVNCKPDPAAERKVFEERIKRGDAHAKYFLALRIIHSKTTAASSEEIAYAKKLLASAAKQGLTDATKELNALSSNNLEKGEASS